MEGIHMPNFAHEHKHLALANRHIKEAGERICKQLEQKAKLEAAGLDTAMVDRLLTLLTESLDLTYLHRTQMLVVLNEKARARSRTLPKSG